MLQVNKDLNNSFRYKSNFRKQDHKLIHISAYSGQEETFGRELDWIAPRGRTPVPAGVKATLQAAAALLLVMVPFASLRLDFRQMGFSAL